MELQTISQISRDYGVSTRTLRYYEQLGLLRSSKKEDYAYRTYDGDAVRRLRQIIVLRKLRIPLRQIAEILQSGDAAIAIDAFERNLNDIEDEITALSTIKSVVQTLLERLHMQSKLELLDDESLLEIVDALTVTKISFKEEKTMEELNNAVNRTEKLTDRDVRIVYLPPATVASAHYIGDGPEGPSDDMILKFIKETNLEKVYPASRHYGFNHPNPDMREDGKYGYERWMTIPDDFDVPAPLEKKRFEGGLYAAYMILPDDLNGTGWHRLYEWAFKNKYWQPLTDENGNLLGSGENMNDLLEEHLNYFNWPENANFHQIDLLMPIKEKELHPTALYVGVWPLPEGQYDPALSGIDMPNGAAIYGLFNNSYMKFSAPESIEGLTEVKTPAELTDGAYCILSASSGFDYVIALTKNPTELVVKC